MEEEEEGWRGWGARERGRGFGGRKGCGAHVWTRMLHPRFPLLTSPRNCPTEIILLVWRLVPQVKAAQEGMARRASCKSAFDLQSPPHKREKSGPEQRRSCHILWDSTDGLGLHTWDRYTELGKRGQSTLPALSRVPSASDQNYIILAPLNPGSQVGLAWLWALLAPASVLSSITSKYLLILQATPLSFVELSPFS